MPEFDDTQVTEDQVEKEARLLGWVDKENYNGDPDNWKPADEFLKRGKEINAYLKRDMEKIRLEFRKKDAELEELKRISQEFAKYHEETEKRAYERALKDLKKERIEAIKEGDTERLEAVEEDIEKLKETKQTVVTTPKAQQPDPAFVAWNAENPWFGSDVELTALANAYSEVVAKENPGLMGKPFLDLVKEKVESVRPEKFGNPNRNRKTVGSSNNDAKPNGKRGKTFNDLPDDAKAACKDFVKRGWVTEEQYLADRC